MGVLIVCWVRVMAERKKKIKTADKLYTLLQNESGQKDFAYFVCEALGSEGCDWLERNVFAAPKKLSAKEKSFAKSNGLVVLDDEKRKVLKLANLLRSYQHRAQMLKDSLSASETANLLSVSRETVHERVRQGKMLGVLENGLLRLPLCQFDANGHNGMLDGFASVLSDLNCSDLSKLAWFTLPNRYFEGRTPIQAMRDGELEAVRVQARAVGVT